MGRLLDLLLSTLTEWPEDGGKVFSEYADYQTIQDSHGRVVFITLYPEEPEIVTYEMWSNAKESQELRELFMELDFNLDPDDVDKAKRVFKNYGYTKK